MEWDRKLLQKALQPNRGIAVQSYRSLKPVPRPLLRCYDYAVTNQRVIKLSRRTLHSCKLYA